MLRIMNQNIREGWRRFFTEEDLEKITNALFVGAFELGESYIVLLERGIDIDTVYAGVDLDEYGLGLLKDFYIKPWRKKSRCTNAGKTRYFCIDLREFNPGRKYGIIVLADVLDDPFNDSKGPLVPKILDLSEDKCTWIVRDSGGGIGRIERTAKELGWDYQEEEYSASIGPNPFHSSYCVIRLKRSG